MGLFTKMFGTRSEREVKKLAPTVDKVMALEEPYKKLSDDELRAKTQEFKTRLAGGETLDDLLPEAFATIREAASRVRKRPQESRPRAAALSVCLAFPRGSPPQRLTQHAFADIIF